MNENEKPTKTWNTLTVIIATVLGSLITVGGIAATFGGYREKVNTHEIEIRDIKQANIELKREIKDDMQRLGNKIDTLTNAVMSNNNRRR